MNGIKISFRDIPVTFTAGIHDLEPERILVGTLDGMRGMAIIARRQVLRILMHANGVHTGHIFLINTFVALGTSRGNIISIDG